MRMVVGIVLILVGLLVLEGTAGYIVAIIGLVPLLAGLFDFCVLAAVLGRPFRGDALRAALRR
jgi:hypothetical protein